MTGFLTLQRWIGAENPRRSVATQDLDSLAVLQSTEYRAATPQHVREQITNRLRLVGGNYVRA